MILKPNIRLAPSVKPMINIGALLDITTGVYIFGKYGECILNGGLGSMTGVVGIGNNFKSTIMHYQTTSALARIGTLSSIMTYDTEINIHEWHLSKQLKNIKEFYNEDVIETQRWQITDKTIYTGDQWYDILGEFMDDKKKNYKKYSVLTPFVDRDKVSNLKFTIPTFVQVDSMSEFTTKDVIKMQDDNALGDSGANMVSMRQGIQKNRFLMEAPSDAASSNTYILLTAHIGTEFVMDMYNPPAKKLQHLKGGVKLKGVPEKFTFVMNNCWHCYNAAPLMNRKTKAPEYPKNTADNVPGNFDMNAVTVKQLRSKSGMSGTDIEILVSQSDGVKPALTEFHFLKTRASRFGFVGDDTNYVLALCPDIKLSRTTVYDKIENNQSLSRSLNFLAEHAQVLMFWTNPDSEWNLSPTELYRGITELGYNWDEIYKTRGWWTIAGMHMDINFLSTMDLIRMYHGFYIPYWMESPPVKAIEKFEKVNGYKWEQSKIWLEDKKLFKQLAKKYASNESTE